MAQDNDVVTSERQLHNSTYSYSVTSRIHRIHIEYELTVFVPQFFKILPGFDGWNLESVADEEVLWRAWRGLLCRAQRTAVRPEDQGGKCQDRHESNGPHVEWAVPRSNWNGWRVRLRLECR